ncbi:MAG: hypothetical protein MH252_13350 [Thermosynechococcaceae cyanobacterium MS004]|nr:hypothetical protein [Thermosynechococcaceae cyanobacterium MS004]
MSTFTVIALGAIGGLVAIRTAVQPFLAVRFDSAEWQKQAGNYGRENPRLSMMNDVERLLPIGSFKAEVEALLGKPDAASEDRYVYDLGRDTLGPHFLRYEISFDPRGRVSHLRIQRD